MRVWKEEGEGDWAKAVLPGISKARITVIIHIAVGEHPRVLPVRFSQPCNTQRAHVGAPLRLYKSQVLDGLPLIQRHPEPV